MTDESKSNTEPWVEKNDMKYAYGYDKNGALKRALKLTGYPTAWLVDASGTIVWQGHPGNLKPNIVEEHLQGALSVPMWEWPDAFSGVAKSLKKRQYAKALEEAEKVAQSESDDVKIRDAIRSMIAGRLAATRKAYEAGDYLTASELAQSAKKEFKGLPEGDEASEIADKISKDRDASAIVKAQKMVRRIGDEQVRSKKDAEKQIAQLEQITRKYPETAAAREADEHIGKLKQALAR